MLPPKTLWKNASLPFHRFFWLPAILDIPGLVAASLHLCFHLHMLFSPLRVSSLCLWVQISFFGWGHQSVDLGLTLIQYEFILPKIHYEKTVFPNKITVHRSGVRTSISFGGTQFHHYTNGTSFHLPCLVLNLQALKNMSIGSVAAIQMAWESTQPTL